jgi:hypothetical protein
MSKILMLVAAIVVASLMTSYASAQYVCEPTAPYVSYYTPSPYPAYYTVPGYTSYYSPVVTPYYYGYYGPPAYRHYYYYPRRAFVGRPVYYGW